MSDRIEELLVPRQGKRRVGGWEVNGKHELKQSSDIIPGLTD
jgi:hypothetical protein